MPAKRKKPRGGLGRWFKEKWVNPKYAVKDTPKEQYDFAMEFYTTKEYKEAVREFKKLLKKVKKLSRSKQTSHRLNKT